MGIVIAIPIVASGRADVLALPGAHAARHVGAMARPRDARRNRRAALSRRTLARTRARRPMKRLESKLPAVGTTIFTVMTQLANEHGAVNLSQGFPNFEPPDRASSSASSTTSSTRCHQYAPMPGSVPLRAAIATKLEELYGVSASPDTEITVTSGATEAIFCAIQAVVRRDDEVIVLDPCYDSYEPSVTLAGGRAVHVCAAAADVRDRLGAPCGRVLDAHAARDREHAAQSGRHGDLARRPRSARRAHAPVRLLSIERRGLRARRVRRPAARDRARAARAPRRAASRCSRSARRITRRAGSSAIASRRRSSRPSCGACISTCSSRRRRRCSSRSRTTCASTRSTISGCPRSTKSGATTSTACSPTRSSRVRPAAGTYFQLADYGEISDLPDVEFARWLTIEHGVATIPISVFYREPPGCEARALLLREGERDARRGGAAAARALSDARRLSPELIERKTLCASAICPSARKPRARRSARTAARFRPPCRRP